jgi:hypothetical protein
MPEGTIGECRGRLDQLGIPNSAASEQTTNRTYIRRLKADLLHPIRLLGEVQRLHRIVRVSHRMHPLRHVYRCTIQIHNPNPPLRTLKPPHTSDVSIVNTERRLNTAEAWFGIKLRRPAP